MKPTNDVAPAFVERWQDKLHSVLRIAAEQARPLRHAVLRPHQSLAHCVYRDDDAPGSVHFGAVVSGQLVGVASIFNQREDGAPDPFSWRLRGMATRPEVRGQGFGRALVEACARHAADQGGLRLWCKARLTAAEFYRRAGFVPVGEGFELPGLGAHQVLERSL